MKPEDTARAARAYFIASALVSLFLAAVGEWRVVVVMLPLAALAWWWAERGRKSERPERRDVP